MTTSSPQAPTGEAREARRVRLQKIIIGLAIGLGAIVGATLAVTTDGLFASSDGGWPPIVAIGVVLAVMVGVPLLMLAAMKTTDEIELAHQAWAMQAGGFALICLYPAWYALWKGGFVAEPLHEAVYVAFFAVTMLGYLFHRYK